MNGLATFCVWVILPVLAGLRVDLTTYEHSHQRVEADKLIKTTKQATKKRLLARRHLQEQATRRSRPKKESMESEAPFSINVTESEGLPPTEIYVIGGNDAVNGSLVEAETPAHGNLSMKHLSIKDGASTLKHPRAPKNKRQVEPKKFTFDELTPKNSLLESRDEGNPDSSLSSEGKPEGGSGSREGDHDEKAKAAERDRSSLFLNVMSEQEPQTAVKTPEEMEHEEGAYWFAECGVPQIDGQNSFPTVPFDEDPDPGEINMFCNRPPATLTPQTMKEEVKEGIANEKIEPRQASPTSPVSSPNMPPLSPKTVAVMSMVDVASFQEDLEMAPSDELENRCSLNARTATDSPASNKDDTNMDTEQEPNEEKKVAGKEAEIPNDSPSDEQEKQEKTETEMKLQEEDATTRKEEEVGRKIEIPSVVGCSGESSEELLLEGSMAKNIGDLRQQLDQLRVSEALEAVSQSFKDQPFMQTEFCGQQIMEWFGNGGRNE